MLLYFLGVSGASKSQRVWGRQSLRDLRGSQWDQERLRESGEELTGCGDDGSQVRLRMNESQGNASPSDAGLVNWEEGVLMTSCWAHSSPLSIVESGSERWCRAMWRDELS